MLSSQPIEPNIPIFRVQSFWVLGFRVALGASGSEFWSCKVSGLRGVLGSFELNIGASG